MKPDEMKRKIGLVFQLGQTYWDQANSDSYAQNRRSDATRMKYGEVADSIVSDALAAIETAWKEGYMARANEEGEEYRCGMEWGRAEERERALCWAKKFAATSRAGYLHFRPLFEAIEQGQPLPTTPTGDNNG